MTVDRTFGFKAAIIAVLTAGMLAGCGGQATVRGKVSNGSGTQQQGLGSQQQALGSGGGFGGSSSVSSATQVQISSIGANGALTVVASANVNADGSYALQVPSGEQKLIVQSMDASGNVVSSAIVESTGSAGGSVTAPPMDTETSVEASVLIQMVAQGTSLAEANAIDVRARINSNVAAAVKATADAGGDAQAKIRGLAEAVIAAQKTELKALAQAGVQTSQSALFNAQLDAAQKLNVALDSGSSSSSSAYADFLAAVQTSAQSSGADAKKEAEAERSAGVAFRATVEARIQASGSGPDPVADAAIRQEAVLEAHASAAAVDAVLKAGSAATAAQSSAVTAESNLKTELSAATTASAAASAFAAYKSEISGGASVSTGVVGAYLGVNATNSLALQAAVTATATAAATLDTALNTAISASVTATGAVNFDALASSIVSAYAAYDSAVQAQATTLAVFGANAQPALDLLVVTQASFELGG